MKVKILRKRPTEDRQYWEEFIYEGTSDITVAGMLDVINYKDDITNSAGEKVPRIAWECSCLQGMCGGCAMVINGRPALACETFARDLGDEISIRPLSKFYVINDLVVDRGAFDKILQAGGFISVRTGSAQDVNNILIPHDKAEESMDAAACVGCGACVATCKNGSAMLFVGARVSSLALLPQGRPEAARRARAMVAKMDELGFGNCTNTRACEMECPKGISVEHIARLNREYLKARFSE